MVHPRGFRRITGPDCHRWADENPGNDDECSLKKKSARTNPVRTTVEMEFNVRPASRVCAATGKELIPGRPCWSVLIERDGRIVRQDYSEESWTGPPEGIVGYWECLVPDRPSSRAGLMDLGALFSYFVQLCESPNSVEQDYQYVLALLLMRKRRLILEETLETEDRTTLRLTGAAGEGPFDVVERDLSEAVIEELQNKLFQEQTSLAG